MASLLSRLRELIPQRLQSQKAPPKDLSPAPITQEVPLPQQYTEAQPITSVASTANTPPATLEKKRKEPKGILKFFSDLNLFFRGMIAMAGLIGIILGLIAISMLTAVDTSFIKLSLVGKVVNPSGVPISQATVSMADQTVLTDANGEFTIGSLGISKYRITITATGFAPLEEEIGISRTFLNYVNSRSFTLQPFSTATVLGTIKVSDSTSYNFADDRIVIGDKEHKLSTDGKFNVPDAAVGPAVNFQFVSERYTDVIRQLEVKPGNNDLGTLDVSPAGDVVATAKSFVGEVIVKDIAVTAEGVPPNQISISDTGELRIRDLEVARSYKIRVSHPQYIGRDYTIGIKQGSNSLFNFKIVEQGIVPFVRRTQSQNQLFTAQYDGSEAKQRTDTQNVDPRLAYTHKDFVYYLSRQDRLSSSLSGLTYLVYRVGLNSGAPERVTTNYANFGTVIPNFRAEKLLNIGEGAGNDTQLLEATALDGSSRRSVFATAADAEITTAKLSNNGNAAAFLLTKSGNKNGIYHAPLTGSAPATQIVKRANTTLFDISGNGDRVLYGVQNSDTGLNDLYVYTVSTKQDTRLRTGYTGVQYQFIQDSSAEIAFIDDRGGNKNIFTLDIDKNSERQITSLRSNVEELEQISQQTGFIVYATEKALYIMDATKRIPGKQITTDFRI